MKLHAKTTEANPNPVIILSRFARLVYANIPAMDLLDHYDLDIGDRIPTPHWLQAITSNIDGVFLFTVRNQNYRWKAKKLHNGFSYFMATKEAESNLLFVRR